MRWLLVIRAVVVLALGVSLLVNGPRNTLLGNLLATFWLLGAVLTLRWALANRGSAGSGPAWAAVAVGVGAAVVGLTRSQIASATSTDTALALLGAVTVAVGLLRILGAFRDAGDGRTRSPQRVALGLGEVVVGVVWIAVDRVTGTVSAVAGLVALLLGAIMLLEALTFRPSADAQRVDQ